MLAVGAVQVWHTTIAAQPGMSWHRVSQQSPCRGMGAARAPLLYALRANAKLNRVIQRVLRMARM